VEHMPSFFFSSSCVFLYFFPWYPGIPSLRCLRCLGDEYLLILMAVLESTNHSPTAVILFVRKCLFFSFGFFYTVTPPTPVSYRSGQPDYFTFFLCIFFYYVVRFCHPCRCQLISRLSLKKKRSSTFVLV